METKTKMKIRKSIMYEFKWRCLNCGKENTLKTPTQPTFVKHFICESCEKTEEKKNVIVEKVWNNKTQ